MSVTIANGDFFCVPVALDALMVPSAGAPTLTPFADFSRLPYLQTESDGRIVHRHEGTPYLSSSILSQPFNDNNGLIHAGIHLHWSLPDALTVAEHIKDPVTGETKVRFPLVPNRWLIRRNSSIAGLDTQHWIVHSNYLWPEGGNPREIVATLPDLHLPRVSYHHQTPDGPDSLPFRYLGLVSKITPGTAPDLPAGGDYLDDLTAMGYGEPLFAALYGNCQGVFGMQDDLDGMDPSTLELRKISYELYGWYAEEEQDELHRFIREYTPKKYNGRPLEEVFEKKFHWTLTGTEYADRLLCRAKLQFSDDQPPTSIDVLSDANPIKLAVGNTGTEALSAHLANELKTNAKGRLQLENQLESLHLKLASGDQTIDLGPVFEEYRHNKAFRPVSGGRLWMLRSETAEESGLPQIRDFHTDLGAATLFLPKSFDEVLDEVNTLQKQFNQANEGIRFLRRQIYTDWQKYMYACYPESHQADPPDIDEIRLHVERLMDLLTLMQAYAGKIQFNDSRGHWTANDDVDRSELPNPAPLLHLLPVNAPRFRSWCQELVRLGEPEQSLATQIMHDLNTLARGLQFRRRMVRGFRGYLPSLELADLQFSMADISNKVRQVDNLIFNNRSSGGVVLPAKHLQPEFAELRTKYSGDELLQNAQEWFIQKLKPLVTLPALHLRATKAPRYYEPNEPVVLMAGKGVADTNRHNVQNGQELTAGKLVRATDQQSLENNGTMPADALYDQLSNGNPWHALFFEWEVRVENIANHSNRNPQTLAYDPNFITAHFKLEETRSEFLVTQGDPDTHASAEYFTGRSLLLPYAQQQLRREIETYLLGKTRQYLQVQKAAGTALDSTAQALLDNDGSAGGELEDWLGYLNNNKSAINAYFDQLHREKLVKTYLSAPVLEEDPGQQSAAEKQRVRDMENNDPINVDTAAFWAVNNVNIKRWLEETYGDEVQLNSFMGALEEVEAQLDQWDDDGIQLQTQALSGFNNALAMLYQRLQIEVAEPNTFAPYQSFSAQVAEATYGYNQTLGMSDLQFHPIRTGKMTVNRLRLVDTFGRVKTVMDRTTDATPPAIAKPERMETSDHQVLLAPRITQASRINLRWLSADENDIEANDHPFTSPICGWLLPNNLDQSIAFYEGSGAPLGYIDQTGSWRLFPGRNQPLHVGDIPNAYLRKLGRWLVDQAATDSNFIAEMVDQWEHIMAMIDPAGFSQHQARSLLVGRPLALVQASVDLELKGWPAVHQDWSHFRKVVAGSGYHTDQFTDVEIPIRLGEHQRLQDGVVSFWLDEGPHLGANRYNPLEKMTFNQAVAAPPQRVSVLMDPRGLLHCTTGVLPTKVINIPPEQYTEALRRIQVAFLTAPILSPPRQIELGLPEEAGFNWAWLERQDKRWVRLTHRPSIDERELKAAFPDGEAVWQRMLTNKWVQPQVDHPHLAFVLTKEEGRVDGLLLAADDAAIQANWAQRLPKIENIVHQLTLGIHDPLLTAKLGPPQEIREGWLSLEAIDGFQDDPLL